MINLRQKIQVELHNINSLRYISRDVYEVLTSMVGRPVSTTIDILYFMSVDLVHDYDLVFKYVR